MTKIPPTQDEVRDVWDASLTEYPDLGRSRRVRLVATNLGISPAELYRKLNIERWNAAAPDGFPAEQSNETIAELWQRCRADSPGLGRYATAAIVAGVLSVHKLEVLFAVGHQAFAEAPDDSPRDAPL